jgi:hypothetical protein
VAAKTNDGEGGGGGGPCANSCTLNTNKKRKNNVEILVKIFIGDNPILLIFISRFNLPYFHCCKKFSNRKPNQ